MLIKDIYTMQENELPYQEKNKTLEKPWEHSRPLYISYYK